MNTSKELIVLRGTPGSGKSTYAEKHFKSLGYTIVEADQYFMQTGEYLFDRNKLHMAHKWCQDTVKGYLKSGVSVVVANTNITLKEVNTYVKIAESCQVNFRVIRLAKSFGSIHNVPLEIIESMKSRMQDYPGETILTDY